MSNLKWNYFDDEESPDIAARPHRPKDRGKMPVAAETKAKAAAKTTWRSKRASKRVAKLGGGIRNRRNKRID